MKDLKTILIAFLLGVSIFSAIRYVSSLKEQHSLQISLGEKKSEISMLQNEKQNLLQEIGKEKELSQKFIRMNALLKDGLRAGKSRLGRLFVKYDRSTEDNERLNSQISILKAENTAVRSEGEKLKLELLQASQEKDALNARFNSVAELKKAIRELKTKKNTTSVEIKKIKVKKKHIKDVEITGNYGYIIKDGVPFSASAASAKVKIEVSEANPASKD